MRNTKKVQCHLCLFAEQSKNIRLEKHHVCAESSAKNDNTDVYLQDAFSFAFSLTPAFSIQR